MMKKRWLSVLSLIMATLMLAGIMTSCNQSTGEELTPGAPSYVSLDINPDVSLTVDENGIVTAVYGGNEDGQVLLYGEEGIVGEPVGIAVEKITALAIELGFLDEENSVVGTDVVSDNAEAAKQVLDRVNTKIEEAAKEAELAVTTSAEAAFSVMRELDALKEKYPDNEAIKSMTASKYKLVAAACATGEVTLEEAVKMDDAALIETLENFGQNIKTIATDAYMKARQEALGIYDKALGIAVDGVYTEFYLENLMKHPTTSYYGGMYQMYASSARGFDAIADALAFVEKVKNYTLDDAQVEAIMSVLGLEETERSKIEDSEGNVTVKSVEAYADKLFKNSKDAEKIEQMKSDLTAALENAESELAAVIAAEAEKYEPQIRATVEAAEAVLSSVKTMTALLPEAIRTEAEACMADYDVINEKIEQILSDKDISEGEMREVADLMREKRDAMLTKIEADLSEEELESIEVRKTEIMSAMTEAKAAFEKALADAETAAKAHLEQLKERYRAKAEQTA